MADKSGKKSDAIVKLVLVFFLSLLSFSVGTFVGKKFSDNQHKLAKFEPSSHNREAASVDPSSTEVRPNDPLSDEEVAKLAEEFVSDDEASDHVLPPSKHEDRIPIGHTEAKTSHDSDGSVEKKAAQGEDAHSAPAPKKEMSKSPHEDQKHGAISPSKEAQRLAQGQALEPADGRKAVSRIPTSLPRNVAASTTIGKFTVQVGSFATEAEAQKRAADLKSQGYSAFFVKAIVTDKESKKEMTRYRVSVGLFTTRDEAKTYMKDLLNSPKISSAFVVPISE